MHVWISALSIQTTTRRLQQATDGNSYLEWGYYLGVDSNAFLLDGEYCSTLYMYSIIIDLHMNSTAPMLQKNVQLLWTQNYNLYSNTHIHTRQLKINFQLELCTWHKNQYRYT